MREIGLPIDDHQPAVFEDLWSIDAAVVITLSDEAEAVAADRLRYESVTLERWRVADPAGFGGHREARLTGYRALRDQLSRLIACRFDPFLASDRLRHGSA